MHISELPDIQEDERQSKKLARKDLSGKRRKCKNIKGTSKKEDTENKCK